jgi:hemoglobin/transferrin/lactoferrin receptor protein
MKKYILIVLLNGLFSSVMAQQEDADTTEKYVQLNEVVISGNKFAEQKKNIAQKIDIIGNHYIGRVNAQNTGDLLMSTGNVFVQKSQQGGSSPVIRGFEASRVLLVVDGVRLNNAIFRSGHLQNVITIDQNMLERVEIMYGPSSTLYGSDALGGVVHMITKTVKLAGDQQAFTPSGNVFSRYSSANNEKTGHFNVNLGYKKIGFLTSVTYSDFGDMKMGKNDRDKYPDFGRRSFYVAPVNGSFADSIIKNNDDRVQRFSGYKQWDIMQKVLFQQNHKISHVLNLQFSGSSNIPRYDRLQDTRNGTLRYAAWYYGPQKRNLYAYTFNARNLKGILNEIRAGINFQDLEESRQTREYQRYDRFDSRREHVKVWGAVLDTRKVFGQHELSVGADAQLNAVQSVADRTDLLTGKVTALDSRYPNGKNRMHYYGIYAQHLLKLADGKFVLNDGIRLQAINLHTTIADNSFFNLPVTDIKQNNFAVTGNLGIVYLPAKATRFSLGFATGMRAPNIDDMARIFESSSARQQVIIPNPRIKPEYTYSFEIGGSHFIAERIKLELSGFYTLFRNAIVVAPFQLNGQDSIDYNGLKSQVLANQNRNKAYIAGGSATISADINTHFSFLSSISYTYGRYKTDASNTSAVYQKQENGTYTLTQANVSEKPLDHIPPLFGKTSIQFRSKHFTTEVFAMYNGWKHLKDYNADGEDNAQYATADGMPSWFTLNWRGSVKINSHITVQLAAENMLDRNYRYFGSGFSAPGRNFIIALRAGF